MPSQSREHTAAGSALGLAAGGRKTNRKTGTFASPLSREACVDGARGTCRMCWAAPQASTMSMWVKLAYKDWTVTAQKPVCQCERRASEI